MANRHQMRSVQVAIDSISAFSLITNIFGGIGFVKDAVETCQTIRGCLNPIQARRLPRPAQQRHAGT